MREDSWDKPKNDWCRGRGFSLVASKQKSVAYSNKVKDTRLPQHVGCGNKYDVSGWCRERLSSAFCSSFKYPSPDAKASPSPSRGEGYRLPRPWCHKILGTGPSMTGARGANSFGRSMIEMLGVLAIIGVLSVGGIAGYFKAMEKFKLNKAIGEYSYLIYGMLENLEEIRKSKEENGNSAILLREVVFAKNLVPDTWKSEEGNARTGMMDPYGNYVRVFSRNSRLVFDVYIGNIKNNESGQLVSDSFSPQFCFALMQDIVVPLHEIINYVWFTGNSTNYYGDRYCGSNSKCISALSLNDLNRLCNYCEKDKSCGLILEF